jgi:hypothetical protein
MGQCGKRTEEQSHTGRLNENEVAVGKMSGHELLGRGELDTVVVLENTGQGVLCEQWHEPHGNRHGEDSPGDDPWTSNPVPC